MVPPTDRSATTPRGGRGDLMVPTHPARWPIRLLDSPGGRRLVDAVRQRGWRHAAGIAWRSAYLVRLMRWPRAGRRERRAVAAVLRGERWGGYPCPGPWTRGFAARFSALHDVPHVIAASSGATALLAAFQGLGLGAGDEVLVPALTFSASATAPQLLGLRAVFIDVDPETMCLDPRRVEAAVTPRTRAIVAVHVGDSICDMDALGAIAGRHALRIVEDCAHAHGAAWKGRPVGGIGDVGCFSFQSGKVMSAGEGGAVTTRDSLLAAACAAAIDCGRTEGRLPEQSCLGINLRLTELQAALLCCAAERFGREQATRRSRMETLRDGLADIPGIRLPRRDPRMTERPTYMFQLLYRAEECGDVPRERFVRDLNDAGFPATPSWSSPVYRSPEYGRLDRRTPPAPTEPDCPVAEWAATRALVWIPHPFFLGPRRHVERLVRTIRRLVDTYRRIGPGGSGA